MALAHVTKNHWRAVERDVLSMHYRVADLSVSEMASVVLAAPANSAVRYSLDEGWPRSDHLMANLVEQGAGLIKVTRRWERPGVVIERDEFTGSDDGDDVDPRKVRHIFASGGQVHTAMPVDELRRKLDTHYAKARAS